MNYGNQAMGQLIRAANTEPQPMMAPIPGAIDRLASAVMTMDADLSTLHDRLHRVLREAPPATAQQTGGVGMAPPISSQTYQQVEMQTARLEHLSRYVRDMLERLEA